MLKNKKHYVIKSTSEQVYFNARKDNFFCFTVILKTFMKISIKQETQYFNPIKKKIRMGWKKNTFSDQLFILCVNVFRYHSKLDFESPIELLNDQPFTKKFKGKVCRRFFALLMNAMGKPLRITKRTP